MSSSLNKILDFSNGVVEVLCLYSRVENLLLVVCYRQPDDTIHGHPSNSKEFKEALQEVMKVVDTLDQPLPDIFMGGDFNLPNIDWVNNQAGAGCSKETNTMFELLSQFTNDFCMKQYIHEQTHKDGNTLDLFFTNNDDLVQDLQCTKPLNSITHHYIIEIKSLYKPNIQKFKENRKKRKERSGFNTLNFFHNDVKWVEINRELSNYDWEREFRNKAPETILSLFLDICFEIVKRYVPQKTTSEKKPSKIVRKRMNLSRRRRRINKLLQHAHSPSRKRNLRKELVEIEVAMMNIYKETDEINELKAVNSIKNNPKYFFNYVKKFSKVKTNVGPLCNSDGKYVSDPEQMSEMLAKQYASVFSTPTSPRNDTIVNDTIVETTRKLNDINFNEDDIESAIDELRMNSAAGLEGYPAILLKECKHALAKPLYILWRRCLDIGKVPSLLKKAVITPIYKGKGKSCPANYRPVALTSHLIKIIEKVIRKNIVNFMDELNLFNNSQHGFRQGRSCLSQLISHFDEISWNKALM